jgi:hypothetical protein
LSILRLDSFRLEVGKYSINQSMELNGNIEDSYYSLFVIDRKLKNISLRLNDFYSEGLSVFCGNVSIDSRSFDSTQEIQPSIIRDILGEPADSWDDGVEVNNQYILNGVHWEFSWHHADNKLIPNYISVGN